MKPQQREKTKDFSTWGREGALARERRDAPKDRTPWRARVRLNNPNILSENNTKRAIKIER